MCHALLTVLPPQATHVALEKARVPLPSVLVEAPPAHESLAKLAERVDAATLVPGSRVVEVSPLDVETCGETSYSFTFSNLVPLEATCRSSIGPSHPATWRASKPVAGT